jgi:hypothetical protein
MNLAVVGSRSLKDSLPAKEEAKSLVRGAILALGVDKIVSGGAAGPDKWSEEAADEMKIETVIYKPDWKTYGKSAGIRRNRDIINDADSVLVFWDGKSKGTSHDIMLARKNNKPYELFVWQKTSEWRLIESTIA